MLEKGQKAPDFASVNQNEEPIRLADYKGRKNVVLYFYPKDDTPGCTIEANQFTALADDFSRADTVVIGVSRDTCASHQAFIGKYDLRIDLLADTDGELCERYGVWQEKQKDGISKMGIVRSTFVIDKEGRVAAAQYGVTADGHAAAILEEIRGL